ncbi:mitochondrial carrier [Lentinus tigrinus ALCF2SS1-7]|uniref:Mitochondrial carrier n=1 Tax=Lentinus tigrinus ALCF2SS1-6 TaxID=1328759 RepID=A0A5C2RV57_9APHY|nr:mitochondrial carrier [Lentinus tigrinus ALCF2SS1-6]RPD70357.1 mitochondrial carrier [Lentinus tigrinus ALCF2SS1-7]
MPSADSTGRIPALPDKNPWAHLLAGAAGGLSSTLLTSPLDVLKTRLQSSLVQRHLPSQPVPAHFLGVWSRHVTGVMRDIYHAEGWRGLFRGLGPSLSGVVPSMALKFYVYGNCKRLGASMLDCAEDTALVHAQAAVAASMTVATVMNPVFVIKTRLQLDVRGSSLNCVRRILQEEGIRGLYRGLGASYLGTVETAFHLVLYEQLKQVLRPMSTGPNTQGDMTWGHAIKGWVGTSGAAGFAKLAAVLVTYPHEVLRTRLRQAPKENGVRKYVGLVQCFRLVRAEEGLAGLYGGMTAHLMRSVPSAFITFGVYECALNLLNSIGG